MIDLSLLDYYDSDVKLVGNSYLGFDVGSTGDRSAIVTIVDNGGILYVDDIVIMHKASYEQQLRILNEVYQKTKGSGFIDSTGIGSAVAEFASKGISTKIKPFTWTSANKTPAYERLRASIFDHKLKFNKKYKEIIDLDFSNV